MNTDNVISDSQFENDDCGACGREFKLARERGELALAEWLRRVRQFVPAGTLVHRYLERHLTDPEFDEARLSRLINDDVSESATGKAKAVLRGFFNSANHNRARAATILGREMPIYLSAFDKAWGGVMDLVIEETGAITGVDYKVMEKPSVLSSEYEQQKQVFGDPNGNRTRATAVKGRCPNR